MVLILIVEDDPQVARLIALVLQRNGYQSETIADGHTALLRAKAVQPAMIVADLAIKGIGGDTLCAILKAQPDTMGIPYIVVSGDRDIAEKARLCGANAYLGKPFEFDDLVRLVSKHARVESRKAD